MINKPKVVINRSSGVTCFETKHRFGNALHCWNFQCWHGIQWTTSVIRGNSAGDERHAMETLSALLTLCARNPSLTRGLASRSLLCFSCKSEQSVEQTELPAIWDAMVLQFGYHRNQGTKWWMLQIKILKGWKNLRRECGVTFQQ